MKPKEFVKEYLPYARNSEKKTGISAIFTLAQAALESGWGKAAPGNMFFGVKDNDGLNGNEQLLVTTEYSQRNDLKFPVIISITPVIRYGKKYFKYKVKDYFRKYKTPEECFDDHASFFHKNPRYVNALNFASNPYQFAFNIAEAGYATDPDYRNKLFTIIEMIEKEVRNEI